MFALPMTPGRGGNQNVDLRVNSEAFRGKCLLLFLWGMVETTRKQLIIRMLQAELVDPPKVVTGTTIWDRERMPQDPSVSMLWTAKHSPHEGSAEIPSSSRRQS